MGGVFFRARSPAVLKRWYEQHLGNEARETLRARMVRAEAHINFSEHALKIGARGLSTALKRLLQQAANAKPIA